MRPAGLFLLGCTLATATVCAHAQGRKPGLWEMTTTTNWQQAPAMPPNMPAGVSSPFANGTTTAKVCLTQAMIDRYGAILPQQRGGCEMTDLVKTAHSMSATMVCSGRMTGKGTVESAWTDDDHATGKIHFTGAVQAGTRTMPIEWTSTSNSVFKSADCGDVKPMVMLERK